MNNLDILVPDLPESVTDATIVNWHKKPGETVKQDEVIVEIETDKVILEIPSLEHGILVKIFKNVGDIVTSREILGELQIVEFKCIDNKIEDLTKITNEPPVNALLKTPKSSLMTNNNDSLSPSLRRLLAKNNLSSSEIKGSGDNGRITSQDINTFISQKHQKNDQNISNISSVNVRNEQRVLMTRLRKRIAERMLEAKNSTAMLTTFNEVNMNVIIKLRKQYGEEFEKRHGTRLGFMSFYIKATIEALKRFPEINACIDGDSILYHDYFDISVAISTPRGLVTPVIRDANLMSMADLEKTIKDLAHKGRNGKLKIDELIGGNFTITNGGVFGSLMSTPIINPPQSAILGIHSIKDRPIAISGQVVIMPMMYLALSYDHRLVDGRESVGFLLTIKDLLENPTRLILDV